MRSCDDLRPGNLARELGLTKDEARALRKDVEFGKISSPWRIKMGDKSWLAKEIRKAFFKHWARRIDTDQCHGLGDNEIVVVEILTDWLVEHYTCYKLTKMKSCSKSRAISSTVSSPVPTAPPMPSTG